MTQKKHTRPFSGQRANSTDIGEHTSFRGGECNFAEAAPSEEGAHLAQVALLAAELQQAYQEQYPDGDRPYDDFLDEAERQLDEEYNR